MPAPKSPPARKASGENIEEWQRKTIAVKLRLSPLAAQAIREGAAREGETVSGYVERVVLAAIPEAE
jgi:uncharacterized protein (DUF1778 family)